MTKRAAYVLRCLGQPALFTISGEAIRIRTKKHLALLVYLAVERRRPHRRDDLAELLWPRATIGEARHSLSTALSFFRARLGRDALDAGRERIVLKADRLALDIDRLLAGDALGDEFTPPLELAAFLEGFDIADAPEFAIWKDSQQARLLPAIKQALVMNMDHCRRRGDFTQIEVLAERMLALDDLSEEAIRAKMEARALAGDRVAALRVFEEWRGKLAEELQAEPSEGLAAIAAQLRNPRWKRIQLLCPPESLSTQQPETSFIGRHVEYHILHDAWQHTRSGSPMHIHITGDSGVGKSTLAQRFASAIQLEGAVISRAQSYDIEREIPYATLSAIVTGLLESGNASATSPVALGELAEIAPEIYNRFPSVSQPSNSNGEAKRVRLTEAFLDLLSAVSDERPILLIIDDLHFADDASVAVIHLSIRRIRPHPVMLLLLSRLGELSSEAIRLQKNASAIGMAEVELDPLADAESEALLNTLISHKRPQPSKTTRHMLVRSAAGYPMTLELLVQDWHVHGNQALVFALGAMTKHIQSSSKAAATYLKLLQSIVIHLSSAEQKTLNLAAILGRRLNDLEMYKIIDLTSSEATEAIATLIDRRILRDNNQCVEFRNELIRSAAYLNVPSPARADLHNNIADRLTRLSTSMARDSDLEIAWHYARSGRQSEATVHLLRGAREALNQGATHSAEYALSTALASLEGESRTTALLLLIEALQDQGRWNESLGFLAMLADHSTCDLAKLFTMQAQHFLNSGTTDAIRAATEETTNVIHSTPSLTVKIKAARIASRFLAELRDEEEANKLLKQIEGLSLDQAPEQEAIELLVAKARCLYHARKRSASLHVILSAIARLQASGTVNSTLCSLIMGHGAIKCQEGKYEDALEKFLYAHATAGRIGNDLIESDAAGQVSLCLCRLGRYQELLQWIAASHAANTASPGYAKIQMAYYSAVAYALLDDVDRAAAMIKEIESNTPSPAPQWLLQACSIFKADALYLIGRQKDAVTVARQGLGYPDVSLHCRFLAGGFARWVALIIRHQQPTELQGAHFHIRTLLKELSQLDALDQVEVLCANLLCADEHDSATCLQWKQKIIEALNNLPKAVEHQLRALGMPYP